MDVKGRYATNRRDNKEETEDMRSESGKEQCYVTKEVSCRCQIKDDISNRSRMKVRVHKHKINNNGRTEREKKRTKATKKDVLFSITYLKTYQC